MNAARPAVQLCCPYQSVKLHPSLAMRSMFGVRYPMIPLLLKLTLNQPMSSPQIIRMLGLSVFAIRGSFVGEGAMVSGAQLARDGGADVWPLPENRNLRVGADRINRIVTARVPETGRPARERALITLNASDLRGPMSFAQIIGVARKGRGYVEGNWCRRRESNPHGG